MVELLLSPIYDFINTLIESAQPSIESPIRNLLFLLLYGLFIGCSTYPECTHTAQLSEQQQPTQAENKIACPSCKKGSLISRQSRFGKNFYACDNYPSCKYAVNDKPVNEFCPECHWPILVERRTTSTRRMICPKKGCGYRSKPI